MADHDQPPPLNDVDWRFLDHCAARNLLERLGWRFVAAGDWAIVLRDPTGRWAARISPFELAYQHYVRICRELPDNRYTPEILLSAELEGGGHLVIMELLSDRDLPETDDPDPLWSSSDPELRALRSAVERVDHSCRESTPWWGGIDVKNSHFMIANDGSLRLVDPLYVAGELLYAAARDDYAAFCKVIPPDRHRYLLQIPHFSQPYASALLAELRASVQS